MMKNGWSRRRFLIGAVVATPILAVADAKWIEPEWVKIRTRRINPTPSCRIVHLTDIHHKGDRPYLESVVEKINRIAPDAVCFTGDLVEEARFLPETLEILGKIKSPLYGVPGNHDYWSGADFDQIARVFRASGGQWLLDAQTSAVGGKIFISGATCLQGSPYPLPPNPNHLNIFLLHYPLLAEKISHSFDLILAGHSHGGQVRLPFFGALMLPYWVGRYDLGMFKVNAGPLHVNPGIGYIGTRIRFNCRPEITVFEI